MERINQSRFPYYLLLAVVFVFAFHLRSQGQSNEQTLRIVGVVSFVTSENVYLRFENTEHLKIEDTLFLSKAGGLSPCLILLQKSSVSCMAKRIDDCPVEKGDSLFYDYVVEIKKEQVTEVDTGNVEVIPPIVPVKPVKPAPTKDPISGRISLANYTTLHNSDVNSRSMARLSLQAREIAGSKLSFRSYINYRQSNITREGVKRLDHRLNVFEFAFDYQIDSSLSLSVGRFINRKMSSVGAIDGMSAEKSWKKMYAGAIVGSRPDPYSYKLNVSLFEAGAYAGWYHGKNKYQFTTLGLMNQGNGGQTDRRYLFLQHSSSLGKKLLFFGSSEIDLFSLDTLGIESGGLKLTSLFLSVNYRLNTKISLMLSYDNRRNLILYRSYEEQLDNLLRMDPIRQGLRFRFDYKATKTIRTGMNISLRTQSDKRNYFYHADVYVSISKLPGIGGYLNTSLSFNSNSTFNYQSLNVRYNKHILKNKLSLVPYYRVIRHEYPNFETDPSFQQFAGIDISYNISRTLGIGLLYDYSVQKDLPFHRFNVNLIKRF